MSRQLSLFGDGALAAAGRESKLRSRRRREGGGAGLRAAVLGSGSGGNSTIVESDEGCLLLDAGFSCRELERRLEAVGRSAADVDAVLLTHEHDDHCRGIDRFARRHQVPVYGTRGTYRGPLLRGLGSFARPMAPGVPLAAAGFRIDVFPVSHDAREPVGIVVESGGGFRFGLATDLGCRTPEAWRNLQDLDILVLESNHDLDMLRTGPYPWRLKERVASKRGTSATRMRPPESRLCFRIVCPGSSFVISRKRTTRRLSPSRRCSPYSIGAARGRSCSWPSSIGLDPGWRLAAERRGGGVELTSQTSRHGEEPEGRFVARVLVYPRAEVLDPQGRAIEDALGRIGFDGVRGIRAGKSFEVALEAADERQATEAVDRMCRQLLANPIVEDYTVEWVSE